MQQSPLLQPHTLGIGLPPSKPTASSQAKQRVWPKPSEAVVGDVFYRYEDRLVSAGVDEFDNSLGSYRHLYCFQYEVTKVTPKGARICLTYRDGETRPVMDSYKNKFAYPTKGEALLGFIARKKRQQQILQARLNGSHEAERLAERQLLKELEP